MIYQMTYVSKVADGVTLSDCKAIAAHSEKNNARDGVTGCLMLCDGWFLQVLEGAIGAVNRIYERIIKDPRHRYPTILGAGYQMQRNFPVWQMRLVHVRDIEAIAAVIRRYHASSAFDPISLTSESCISLLNDPMALEDSNRKGP
ncbi:MAG: BLUF domain-containing protein [Planctomycetota bacterium]|nr:MAG: BLUF domain-containing protein [Planctomycetota bacterium]